MRRAVTIAVALLAAVAAAQGLANRYCLDDDDGTACGFTWPTVSAIVSAVGGPLFEFAPASGAGLPVAQSLCDTLTGADKVGNWWCWDGADGGVSSADAGVTFTAYTGSPTPTSGTVCPSGPSCATAGWTMHDGNDISIGAAAHANPAEDFSVLCLGAMWGPQTNAAPTIAGQRDDTKRSWLMYRETSTGNFRSQVFKANGSLSDLSSGVALMEGAHHLTGFSYDYVTDGTSVMRTYVNGTAGGTTSTAVGPPQAGTSKPSIAGIPEATTYPAQSLMRGCFYTEKVLGADRIAAIARAVLADTPTGSKGEALTYTRATASSVCPDADCTSVSILPAGRPGIAQGGLQVYRAATNVALRSEELENAAHADQGTPATTANSYVAPDGSLTAEKFTDNDGAAFEGRCQTIATASLTKHTGSAWARCDTGACEARISITGTGNSAGDTTCDFTALTTGWKRLTCPTTAAYAAGLTAITVCLLNGDGAADQYAMGWWGEQYEVSAPYATPYIRTTSASAARNASYPTYFAAPAGLKTSPASFAGTRNGPATSPGQENTSIVGLVATSPTESSRVSLLFGTTNGLDCYGDGNRDRRVVYAPAGSARAWCAVNNASGTPNDRVVGEWPTGTAFTNQTATSSSNTATALHVLIGNFAGDATYAADGIISNVCADSRPSRCR